MIEAICFEKEHRYLPEELDTYRCQGCGKVISLKEFNQRAFASTWVDGKAPLELCTICMTWHVPQDFDINSRMEISRFGRNIEIIDTENGRFVFETDRDESGYVTADCWFDAIEKIKSCLPGTRSG